MVSQGSNEIHFCVKQTTQMSKLKRSYSERARVPVTSRRFLFDGRRINNDETSKALEMEQDDLSEVMASHKWPGRYESCPRSMFGYRQGQVPTVALTTETKATIIIKANISAVAKVEVSLLPLPMRSRQQRLSRSRSDCLRGQVPAAAITTEDKVKVQLLPPPMRSRPPESTRSGSLLVSKSRPSWRLSQGLAATVTEASVRAKLLLPQIKLWSGPLRRSRYTMPSRPRLLLPPLPLRSRPCCRQDKGPSATITTKVKAAATVKSKTPAATTKVMIPAFKTKV